MAGAARHLIHHIVIDCGRRGAEFIYISHQVRIPEHGFEIVVANAQAEITDRSPSIMGVMVGSML